MDMGYADYGGGPVSVHDHGQGVSVPDLRVDPHRRADVTFQLATEESTLTVGGKAVPGYTVNGTSPGPTLTAVQGQLIEVQLTNVSVKDGVALHWHGIDVPNSMDGVAGVTQDAVPVGGEVHLPLRRGSRSGPTGTTPIRCRTSRSPVGCSARW